MHEPGDVILTNIQYNDTFEIKKRPALVLFKEHDNIIVAGITSNKQMEGISLTKKEGAIKDSIIKLNYTFTISSFMVEKKLFSLTPKKRKRVLEEFMSKIKKGF